MFVGCSTTSFTPIFVGQKKFLCVFVRLVMLCSPSSQEQPYPDDETLQRGLQDKINWESFKTKTLNSTMHKLTQSTPRLSLDI